MRAFLTLSPVGAEPGKIELADVSANVPFAAARSERTETFLVMWAWGKFRGGIDMQVEALVTVGAIQGARVVIALRHPPPDTDVFINRCSDG